MLSTKLETDVVVVGSGGAGLRAAIEAAKSGDVILISKGPFARGGASIMAGADIMLDGKSLHALNLGGDSEDSKEAWYRDILVEGFELNDPQLVQSYVESAPERVKELLDWGMNIDPESQYQRAIITTGFDILHSLRKKLEAFGVDVLENTMVTDLLSQDGTVFGVVGLDYLSGEVFSIHAKSVVLATGGWHELYAYNTGSDALTGDGVAMAYRAGASLTNMEMTTFCPNIIRFPLAYSGTIFLYNFPGQLLNNRGDAFIYWFDNELIKLAQTTEWNKLLLSYGTALEIQNKRGSPHDGVYFSIKHFPINLLEQLQTRYQWKGWRFQGMDFSALMERMKEGEAIEVGPAAHYFEGGIRINRHGETNLKGLFAAGECTGGLFGANRVSAATTEMLVQGAIAGKRAGLYANSLQHVPETMAIQQRYEGELTRWLGQKGTTSPRLLRRDLQRDAYQYLGVLRDRRGLETALSQQIRYLNVLNDLKVPSHRSLNKAWLDALELRNLVDIFKLVARSALAREESRGVHFRSDRSMMDNENWLCHLVAHRCDDQLVLEKETISGVQALRFSNHLSYENAIREAASLLRG